jgi:beta-hydroxyacyl-ACP dehydratase FabZ
MTEHTGQTSNEDAARELQGPLDIQQILRIAPHRYPFLLVDRLIERTENKAVAIKNVTYNEPIFMGHFPERPVFPGVLMLEALAQVGGVLVLTRPQNLGKIALLAAADDIKWRRRVIPGDQMRIEVEMLKERQGFGLFKGQITVEGELACEATIKFVVSEERKAL